MTPHPHERGRDDDDIPPSPRFRHPTPIRTLSPPDSADRPTMKRPSTSQRPSTKASSTKSAKASASRPSGTPRPTSASEAANGEGATGTRLRFKATLREPIDEGAGPAGWTFLVVPKVASTKLPSRGMVSVEGTFAGVPFATTLRPDGDGGHWLRVDLDLRKTARVAIGDDIAIEMTVASTEPEPSVPSDLGRALASAPAAAREAWSDITPAARRDFIHWIESAKKAETRDKRVATACDMLAKGKRRPCCFDRSGMYDKSLSCPVARELPPRSAG